MQEETPTTCKTQWISDEGKPTPDNNPAVMMAHYHEPIWSMPGGGIGNKITRHSDKIRDSFPICADHYARVTPEMLWPRGGWSFTNL